MSQPKPIRWQLDADTRKFTQGVARAERSFKDFESAAKQADRASDIDVDVDDSALDILRRRLRETRRELLNDLDVNVDVDVLKTTRQISTIENRLKALDRLDVRPEVKVDIDRNLGRTVAAGTTKAFANVQRIVQTGLAGSIEGGIRAASANPFIGAGIAAAVTTAAAAASPAIIAGVGTVVGAAITKGLAETGEKLLTAYADIEVANARAETVFGKQLAIIDDWSRALSSKAGLGAQELKAQASAVQDLLVPQGFSRAEAAGITTQIVERGLALAAFYNEDPAAAIDAVTKALLGERDALKGLGVSISQQEVNDWIKDNASQLEGLSEAQQVTVATTELLAEKTADAADKFEEGGNSAQELLNKINALKANLKTDAIEGFGRIFVDVLTQIQRNLDFDFDAGGLKNWIDDNETRIRLFIAQITELGANAALATLQFGKALLQLVDPAIQAAKFVLLFAEATTWMAQALAGPANLLPGVRDMFTDVRNGIDTAQEGLGAFEGAWGTIGPAMVGAVDDGIGALTGLRDGVALTRREIEAVSGLEIKIETILEEDGRKEAKQYIRDLSLEEINLLVKTGVVEDEKLQSWLAEYQEKRINIEVKTTLKAEFGTDDPSGLPPIAQDLFRRRKTELQQELRIKVTANTSELDSALEGIPDTKDVAVNVDDNKTVAAIREKVDSIGDRDITIDATDGGTVKAIADRVDGIGNKEVLVAVDDRGSAAATDRRVGQIPTQITTRVAISDNGAAAVVAGRIALATRDRTARVNVTDTGSASVVSGRISLAARTRTARVRAEAPNWRVINSLLNYVARRRYATIVVSRQLGAVAPGAEPQALPTVPRAAYQVWPQAGQRTAGGATAPPAAATRAGTTFAPTIINNYPAPERASDSVAVSLRLARYQLEGAS